MDTDKTVAAAATNIQYSIAYGRSDTWDDALAKMQLQSGAGVATLGTPAENLDMDEQSVIDYIIQNTLSAAIAEVPITLRDGQKRTRRNIFIYAVRQVEETSERMAMN